MRRGRAWRAALLAAAFALPALPPAAGPETIVSGLSQSRVAITADFDGSEILVYGAVRRDSPAPEGRMEVIITVEGPSGPVMVRRKDRVAGIWINDAAVRISSAPEFYAVATTGRLDSILSATEDIRHAITIDRLVRSVGIASQGGEPGDFLPALIRVRMAEGRYRLLQGMVEFVGQTLFRTDVMLPANLTEGEYRVRMFLLRDGAVVAEQERKIRVRKAGLERLIYRLANDRPATYGLLALAIAALAGYGASAGFRLLRR